MSFFIALLCLSWARRLKLAKILDILRALTTRENRLETDYRNAFFSALIRFIRLVVKWTPLSISLRVGRSFGYLSSFLFGPEFRIACLQLNLAGEAFPNTELGRAKTNSSAYARRSFQQAGALGVEIFSLERLMDEIEEDALDMTQGKETRYPTGAELVRLSLDKGRPTLVLSGHVGCFELLAASYARHFPLYAVGRRPNYSSLNDALEKLRNSRGVTTLWREDRRSLAKLATVIKKPVIITTLIDQDINLENIFVPFFGIQAAVPVLPLKLATKYNLSVICAFIIRTSTTRHKVIARRIFDETDSPTPEEIALRYNQQLEAVLSDYPSQWVWWHRRWRREPGIDYSEHPEALRSTSSYLEWLQQEAA